MADRKPTLTPPPVTERPATLRLVRADGTAVPPQDSTGADPPSGETQPSQRPVPALVRGGTSPQELKPWGTFPLTAHPKRGWIKKIRGRQVCFGPLHDPHGANERYHAFMAEQNAAITRAITPSPTTVDAVTAVNQASAHLMPEGLTVRQVANAFVHHHQARLKAGEIQARSFADYFRATEMLVNCCGATTPVAVLGPPHFTELRDRIYEATESPGKRNQLLVRIRSIFKFAEIEGLIHRRPAYGVGFRKPPKSAERKRRAERGEQMFSAVEIRRLLEHANPVMKAMILLGINGGLGNTDLSQLRDCHLTLGGTRIQFPRSKTGIDRTIPLWPETAEAVRDARASRPPASTASLEDRVFLTRFGKEWVKTSVKPHPERATPAVSANNAISGEFSKLGRRAGLERVGGGTNSRGFYALRHTFRTVADECHDRPAIDRLMGHENANDMSTTYRERIEPRRLVAVTDFVRAWLYAQPTTSAAADSVNESNSAAARTGAFAAG